jgi:hypothetical protein
VIDAEAALVTVPSEPGSTPVYPLIVPPLWLVTLPPDTRTTPMLVGDNPAMLPLLTTSPTPPAILTPLKPLIEAEAALVTVPPAPR